MVSQPNLPAFDSTATYVICKLASTWPAGVGAPPLCPSLPSTPSCVYTQTFNKRIADVLRFQGSPSDGPPVHNNTANICNKIVTTKFNTHFWTQIWLEKLGRVNSVFYTFNSLEGLHMNEALASHLNRII